MVRMKIFTQIQL